MKNLSAVVVFEYLNIVKRKSYAFTLGFFTLIIIGISFAPAIIALFAGDPEPDRIAYHSAVFHDETGLVSPAVLRELMPEFYWQAVGRNEMVPIVEAGDAGFALHFEDLLTVNVVGTQYFFVIPPYDVANFMRRNWLLRELHDRGFTAAEADYLARANVAIELTTVRLAADDADEPGHIPGYFDGVIGTFATIAVFILVSWASTAILTSVTAEKTTKTVELIFVSAKPTAIIFGKVIASVAMALTTLLVLFAVGYVVFSIAQSPLLGAIAEEGVQIAIPFTTIVYLLVFTLCALVSFSFMNAAFASTVRDAQEGSSLAAIPQFLLMAAYFLALMGANPGFFSDGVVNVLTYAPFVSPMFMIVRITSQYVPANVIFTAIGLNVAYAALLALVSSRIYRLCIMAFGQKITFKVLASKFIKG